MLKDRRYVVVIALLAVNAACPILFRFFLTLDGPMHVLHAFVLKAHWFGGHHHTPQLCYTVNSGTLDLTDLLLVPLTALLSPERAQAAYAGLLLACWGIAAVWWSRAVKVKEPFLLLWLLPLSWSYIFVLGFFTFLFAASFAWMALAWWIQRGQVRWRTLVGACIAIAICQATHRAGGPLAVLFIACHELTCAVRDRTAWRTRWALIPRWVSLMAVLTPCAAVGWKVSQVTFTAVADETPFTVRTAMDFFLGRPLVLFAGETETPWAQLLMALMLAAFAAGVLGRWKNGERHNASDGLLLAACVLLFASFLFRTFNSMRLFMDVRAQVVALPMFMFWCAANIPRSRWTVLLACCLLVVHTVRSLYTERVMAGSRGAYEGAIAVVDHLPSHGVVLPVVRDDNWLHDHLPAFAAASYAGVFWTPNDHLGFKPGCTVGWKVRHYHDGHRHELDWLEGHVASGACPIVHRIVFFGHGQPEDERLRNINAALRERYTLQWKNGYAEVWMNNADTLRAHDTAP